MHPPHYNTDIAIAVFTANMSSHKFDTLMR